jgi:hypothetical protein
MIRRQRKDDVVFPWTNTIGRPRPVSRCAMASPPSVVTRLRPLFHALAETAPAQSAAPPAAAASAVRRVIPVVMALSVAVVTLLIRHRRLASGPARP